MKKEDLTALGLTDEQIAGVQKLNGLDIAAEQKKAEKIIAERDNYKSQLETAQTALKEFEGVNVNDLKGKIETLTNELNQKETEYQNKIADMEFNSKLESAINSFGARNVKAVKALLDIDSLKSSKNQDADIKTALEACQKENDYLFGSNEPINNPIEVTQGTVPETDPLASMKLAMGLTTENK